ncbi:MAG TPA: HAMP domain-containing sensor histidine kinase [Burkholderiaceae bacterium]|nr:HAMP domain-containing sensor histidine kinase [Burkholderiaceae bacterium]
MPLLNRYPKSLIRLILLGYGMVLIPLLLAGLHAVYAVTQLQRDGVIAIDSAVGSVRHGLQMTDHLLAMERLIRQYEVLSDPSLLDEYAAVRQKWRQASDAFTRLAVVAPLADEVRRLEAGEEGAYARLQASPEKTEVVEALGTTIGETRGALAGVLTRTDQILAGSVSSFRGDAEALVHRLAFLMLAALPLSLAVVLVFRRMFRRLAAQFEAAIDSLGSGQRDREIRLGGPMDVRFVGRRLEWLRRRLIELESQRNQFLRNASHELKTPLAAIREGTQLLIDDVAGHLTAQQRKIADIMATNVRRLQTLIDVLLRLQQASYDAERIQPQDVAIGSLLREVVSTHQLVAEQRGVRVKDSLDPLRVQGGAEQLRIVFDNLVSNAIKFSPEGGCVKVDCHMAEDRVVVDVADEGPGIVPQDRQRIFEAFVRLNRTESVEGNGLGLAIAREFVAAHRGTIEVLDSLQGACFRVSLPVQWQRG